MSKLIWKMNSFKKSSKLILRNSSLKLRYDTRFQSNYFSLSQLTYLDVMRL